MGMQYHAFCTGLGAEISDITSGSRSAPTAPTAPPSVSPRQRGFKKELDDDEGDEHWDHHPGQAGPAAAGGGGGVHKVCSLSQFDSSAVFLGFGHLFQWERTLITEHLQLISRTLASLKSNDVVLFSVGVHWHYFCDQPLKPDEVASFSNFEHALRTLMSLLPPPAQMHENVPSPDTQGRVDSAPTILYRESLPQHFASANGQFPSPFRHRSRRDRGTSVCPDMTEFSSVGLGGRYGSSRKRVAVAPANYSSLKVKKSLREVVKTKTNRFIPAPATPASSCDPNCLPATWQNDLAATVLEAERRDIDIVRVFRSLECLPHEHSKKNKFDCTHFSARVNMMLNFMFLGHLTDRS